MIGYPQSPEEITPEWLSGCLARHDGYGCAVERVETELHSSQGALSQVFQLRPTWACGAMHGEPTRLIAKLPSAFAGVRAFAGKNALYRNESRWYRDFGPDAGIPLPVVYASSEAETPERFFILMEDMWPSTPGGARPPLDLVELGVDVLAAFHAKWWQQDAVLLNRWLPGVNLDRDEEWMAENESSLAVAADENRSRYGEIYLDYVFRSALATAKAFRRIRERTQARPRTLLHGDFTTRSSLCRRPTAADSP